MPPGHRRASTRTPTAFRSRSSTATTVAGRDLDEADLWLSRLYYDTVLHSHRSLRMLVDLVGARHVVLGSDYPFEMGDPDPLATLAGVPGLSDGERQQIRSGNIARLISDLRQPRSAP
ncbi:MAG: amidohydrolase family protein [bacterium]